MWHEETDEFLNTRTRRRYRATSFEGKVSVYETRVREWFLDIALGLVSGDDDSPGDYTALSIALAYIGGVEQYRRGTKTPNTQSGNWFKASAKRVLPGVSNEAINRLWVEARCGLFHSGFTDGLTYLSHDVAQALEIDQGKLLINPRKFVEATVSDFSTYVDELRAAPHGELGVNFQRLWDHRWENS